MTILEEYLKHDIMEQGWIKSFTIPDAKIHVACRKNWNDYSNLFADYLKEDKQIYFKLTKEFPTYEQFKENYIVSKNVTEEDIKAIYDFITSPDALTPSWTVYFSVKDLLKSMEYEKLPLERYTKLLSEGRLNEFIDL